MRILVTYFLVMVFTVCGVLSKTDCEVKLQKCENRKPIPRRPVCGSDGQTYPHRCALLKARCTRSSPLTVKHKGKCRKRQPCLVDRNRKLKANKGKDESDYIPECLSDGTYAPVQCHTSMGYCWCVTPIGKMIPRTTTARNRKIECHHRGKGNSGFKNVTDDSGNFSKKGCDQTDKNIFVNNLVRIFKTEYNRDAFGKQYQFLANESTNRLEDNAIRWKFVTLDKDKNDSLSKNEYRDLRKLIKKVVKPRRCSCAFVRLCDADRDSVISKNEWTNCLHVNNAEDKHTSSEETTVKHQDKQNSQEVDVSSTEETPEDNDHTEAGLSKSHHVFPLIDHSSSSDRESEDKPNDCYSDRNAVLEERNQEIYVPECTSDGLYKKVQCYPSTGYCWCVLEDSGKPIPGTSVRDSDPNCDSIPQLLRPMKGCPDNKKTVFIKDLMVFFETNLTKTSDLKNEEYESNDGTKGNQKKLEQLASLAFRHFDTNKNEVLDRKEWKSFRALMSTMKPMKRCGRKFPRYCDANSDKKVTKTEWTQCLNLQIVIPVTRNPHTNVSNTKRRGPNPMESILKDDD